MREEEEEVCEGDPRPALFDEKLVEYVALLSKV